MKSKGPMELKDALNYLTKEAPETKRVRAERIASDLGVSFGTIKSWMSGRRNPKKGTVVAIGHLYGIRICE